MLAGHVQPGAGHAHALLSTCAAFHLSLGCLHSPAAAPFPALLLAQGLPDAVGTAPPTAQQRSSSFPFPELRFLETHPTHPAVQAAARQWGKAFQLSCWLGHMTPWRAEWFAELVHPDHWPERCPFGECRRLGCRGDGVRRSADGLTYHLVVEHHKTSDNSGTRDRAPIYYPFPPSLFVWVDVWTRWCWPLIAAQVCDLFCAAAVLCCAAAVQRCAAAAPRWGTLQYTAAALRCRRPALGYPAVRCR